MGRWFLNKCNKRLGELKGITHVDEVDELDPISDEEPDSTVAKPQVIVKLPEPKIVMLEPLETNIGSNYTVVNGKKRKFFMDASNNDSETPTSETTTDNMASDCIISDYNISNSRINPYEPWISYLNSQFVYKKFEKCKY